MAKWYIDFDSTTVSANDSDDFDVYTDSDGYRYKYANEEMFNEKFLFLNSDWFKANLKELTFKLTVDWLIHSVNSWLDTSFCDFRSLQKIKIIVDDYNIDEEMVIESMENMTYHFNMVRMDSHHNIELSHEYKRERGWIYVSRTESSEDVLDEPNEPDEPDEPDEKDESDESDRSDNQIEKNSKT